MSELENYFVKISTNNQGDCLVEVAAPSDIMAVNTYKNTIEMLKEEGFAIAIPHNDMKVSNENTKFQKTVTVSGRGEQVGKVWLEEISK